MPEIITIYAPRLWTKELHESQKRWKVVMAHRRSGKTTASINHLIRDAMRVKESRYAFIAPTYTQAKDIVWDIIKKYAGKVDGVRFNESELRADLANGSRIRLYGADNPDSLRGIGLWGVVFDEYSQQPSNIFSEIIRPALADHEGYAIWIGTPKGKNDFVRLYQRARIDGEWLGMLKTVDDTGIISEQELADSAKVMTADEYQQEWYCSWEAAVKGAYYAQELAQAHKDKRITRVLYDNSLPVHTVWDLGVSDAMSIGFFQKVNQEVRMIDYYESTDKGLDHYAKVLKAKGYVYGKYVAPHDINARELTTGKSRQEIAQGLGLNFDALPNIALADGIHAGRMMFNRLWVDEEKCSTWVDYIAQYRREWDDVKGMFRDKPLHDFTSHAADMYRYAALAESMFSNSGGSILTKDIETNAKPGIVVNNGFVSGDQVILAKEPKDWRFQ